MYREGKVLQINLKQSLDGWFITYMYTAFDCLNQLRANYVLYVCIVSSECIRRIFILYHGLNDVPYN